ncbi:growth/differentiation factor 6-A [Clupea harengus]|uniref:Growth/differentiation factor 6-A n=1 Tax=Clupea harengus TaxID=7950 RepID=A0A8M1KVY2_CLUHA|nr:growth/differentiation factor 6-A [Clupea harengus]
MILTLSIEQRGVSKVIKPFQLSHFGQRPLKMNPMKAAALSLCVSFLFANGLHAAVLGSLKYPFAADDHGLVSHLDVQNRGQSSAIPRSETPRNGTAVHIPSYMISLYRTLSQLERRGNNSVSRSTRHANTVTSFMDIGKDYPLTETRQRYVFDLSSLSRADELVEAELRILRKTPPDLLHELSQGGSLYRVLLYPCSSDESNPVGRRQPIGSQTIDILDSGTGTQWDVFDVSTSLKMQRKLRWSTGGGGAVSPLCFDVVVVSDATDEATAPWALGYGRQALEPQERALLVAFTRTRRKENLFREIREKMRVMAGSSLLTELPFDPGMEGRRLRRRRRRRTALTGRPGGTGGGGGGVGGIGGGSGGGGRRRTRCSRKALHVNFKQLGWDDWIIAPLDYEAYHCEGVCDFPLRSHLEPTNHAIIQTLMNSMDPEATPPSCCVPSKLSPISILYIDSGNNVVYKQYEDMVVESCGCR